MTNMFLCRTQELNLLTRRYKAGNTECVVIYGRRRVGKTALINEFTAGKKTIFFPALKANASDNLEALSKAIALYKTQDAASAPIYRSFDDAFAEITRIAAEERVIFVIDELPYLCDADASIPSRLQHLLDHDWAGSKLFLILCGSSMSFMEKEVLSSKSPLFGRRTFQLKLEPLSFTDAKEFHPELTAEENALIYGITGGVPHYINKLGVRDSIRDALLENFFDRTAYLFEEPDNLLRQELREPAVYNSIITAIADGASRQSDIASKVHMETSQCNKYLKVLIELGILEKVEPVIDRSKRKVIYRITDNFFRFWYRYVPGNMMAISSGRMDRLYDTAVGGYLSDFMGQPFEYMCRTWLIDHMDQLPFQISDIGEWWGAHPQLKKEVQLDIVATSVKSHSGSRSRQFLIGSCKYRNEKIGTDELELIREYASVFTSGNDECFYYIFSKGGFTEGLLEAAKRGEVTLLTLEDLYK